MQQIHQFCEPSSRLRYELPLRKVLWLANLFVMLFGVAAIAGGVTLIVSLTPASFVGGLLCWFGCFCLAIAKNTNVRPVSKSSNSCLPISLYLCLEFVGGPWDIDQLEEKLGWNTARGTRIDRVLLFLRSCGISHNFFGANSIHELEAHLRKNRSPCSAIVDRPLLHWSIWKFVFAPWRVFSKRSAEEASHRKHAVVVYGVERNTVLVFDPNLSALHRVRWKDFAKELVPVFGVPFLSILPD